MIVNCYELFILEKKKERKENKKRKCIDIFWGEIGLF